MDKHKQAIAQRIKTDLPGWDMLPVQLILDILDKAGYFDLPAERDRLQREVDLCGSVTVWLGCRKCGTEWSMTVGLPFSFNDYECPECEEESYENIWIRRIDNVRVGVEVE